MLHIRATVQLHLFRVCVRSSSSAARMQRVLLYQKYLPFSSPLQPPEPRAVVGLKSAEDTGARGVVSSCVAIMTWRLLGLGFSSPLDEANACAGANADDVYSISANSGGGRSISIRSFIRGQ